MALHKNALPAKLLDAVESGEEKSIQDWAKHFKVKRGSIGGALKTLRKRGFMLYPIGGVSNPSSGEFTPGIVKNILDSKEHTREIINRNNRQETTPRLKSQFRLLEETIMKWPKMIAEAETEANHYMRFLIDKKEELKKLEAADGNNTTTTK